MDDETAPTSPQQQQNEHNDNPLESPSSSSSSSSFHDTMVDLANWWCHYILQNTRLELFDELSELLEFLAPIPEHSPLAIRLRCLVVWQELLKLTTVKAKKRTNNENIDGITAEIVNPPLESRNFDTVQDTLIVLHTKYFSNDGASDQAYQDVLRMVKVHHELCGLYQKLDSSQYSDAEIHKSLDSTLEKGRDEIFLGDQRKVPVELQEIVVKENGWTNEERRRGIEDILLHNGESDLSVKWLLIKTQMILLYWCERRLEGGVPVLVKMRYRNVGIVTRDPNTNHAGNQTEVGRSPDTSTQSICTMVMEEEGPRAQYSSTEEEKTDKPQQQRNESFSKQQRQVPSTSAKRPMLVPSQNVGKKPKILDQRIDAATVVSNRSSTGSGSIVPTDSEKRVGGHNKAVPPSTNQSQETPTAGEGTTEILHALNFFVDRFMSYCEGNLITRLNTPSRDEIFTSMTHKSIIDCIEKIDAFRSEEPTKELMLLRTELKSTQNHVETSNGRASMITDQKTDQERKLSTTKDLHEGEMQIMQRYCHINSALRSEIKTLQTLLVSLETQTQNLHGPLKSPQETLLEMKQNWNELAILRATLKRLYCHIETTNTRAPMVADQSAELENVRSTTEEFLQNKKREAKKDCHVSVDLKTQVCQSNDSRMMTHTSHVPNSLPWTPYTHAYPSGPLPRIPATYAYRYGSPWTPQSYANPYRSSWTPYPYCAYLFGTTKEVEKEGIAENQIQAKSPNIVRCRKPGK